MLRARRRGAFQKGHVTVDPACPKLRHFLTAHTWELAKKQEEMTHLLDAMRYGITFILPGPRTKTAVRRLSA